MHRLLFVRAENYDDVTIISVKFNFEYLFEGSTTSYEYENFRLFGDAKIDDNISLQYMQMVLNIYYYFSIHFKWNGTN